MSTTVLSIWSMRQQLKKGSRAIELATGAPVTQAQLRELIRQEDQYAAREHEDEWMRLRAQVNPQDSSPVVSSVSPGATTGCRQTA